MLHGQAPLRRWRVSTSGRPVDRSRLTQHGMMVGTVAYMPPEQALAGETAPQADLYSLGAMLYELVTGRPPFVGEDPTAIISQHINTPPVAPSWHSERCPPDLEELILRLLAKAPEDRPASAAEVLAALEAVDPAATSARDSGANPLGRLARGVFVGRETELERLRFAFDSSAGVWNRMTIGSSLRPPDSANTVRAALASRCLRNSCSTTELHRPDARFQTRTRPDSDCSG